MKVAIFGASGFLGYDFVRLLVEKADVTPVLYCTSPQGLTNLSRHEFDLRFVPYSALHREKLDSDIECVVNFGHPFRTRDELSPAEQVRAFAEFLRNQIAGNAKLKLIHLSSMSVLEPFAGGGDFSEEVPFDPPRNDEYATTKALMERALEKLPHAESNQLILRPTVVYGPFCRPWTDGPMSAFAVGDVIYSNLDGAIQPIYGRDISRFIYDRLKDFRSGLFNIAGKETMSWMQFLRYFEEIVDEGRLVARAATVATTSLEAGAASRLGKVSAQLIVFANRSLGSRFLRRIARYCPVELRQYVHRKLSAGQAGAGAMGGAFDRPFFSGNRLVSRVKLAESFPDFLFSTLDQNRDELRSYYQYRFTDQLIGSW